MIETAVVTQFSLLAYLAISIAMTIWVARTLSRNGEVFLVMCFGQNETLARSTNHLLVVGFYLINIGFIALRLDGWNTDALLGNPVAHVGSKIGVSVLMLGAMHFFNMLMISRYGRTVAGWMRDQRYEQEVAQAAGRGAPPPLPGSMR
ncbi:hypothetical protein [Lysobacter silvisoli]|uniref:hypothetical protein n=1 Tax=Lysobacter silvisoli TaxID=2293254 RepID=UPI0018C87BFF|nr:hypothetical protein [Lysobacter silvisoli]